MKETNICGDRLMAYLMVDGKFYQSDCDHQDCLEMYYADRGIKSEFNWGDPEHYEEVKEAAVQKTYAMKCNHTAYGFDMFDTENGLVLLAHDKHTYENNKGWMAQTAHKEGAKIAYFTKGFDAILVS